MGHYLNLDHIWGGGCNSDDGVADTPSQQTSNGGCPTLGGTSSCNTEDLHMNYMDYTNDACMYMFSAGQSTIMENYVAANLTNVSSNFASVCSSAAPTCTDGIQNGDETGVDCGGSACPACETCSDGIQNQDETGVDCGGATCPACPCTDNEVTVTIVQDNYSSETTWTITNSSGTVVLSGGPYTDGNNGITITETVCLVDGCYDFTINDSYGDGICCNYGNGSYAVTDASGATLASGGQFTSTEVTAFCFNTVPTCTDGVLNGDETGIDCGGSTCPACPQCDIPTGLTAVANDTLAELNWTAVPAAVNYDVRARQVGATTWVTGIELTPPVSFTNLSPCTEYEFQVLSDCSTLESAWSSSFVFTTTGCPESCTDGIQNQDETGIDCGGATCPACVCSYPNNIAVNLGMDPNRVNISWDPVSGVSEYQVRYRRALTSTWSNLLTTTTSRVVQVLVQNKVYDYRVRSKCPDGTWSDMSPIDKFRTVQCLAPVNLTHTQQNNNKVKVEWTNYDYSDKYQIFFREAGTSTWSKMVTYYEGMNFRVLNNLTPGATYEWKVRSWCEVSYGPFSAIETFTNASARDLGELSFGIVNLYPNPTSNTLNTNFTIGKDSDVSISITDVLGRTIYQNSANYNEGSNTERIDVSSFEAGYYMIQISDGENVSTKKFVKK